MKLEYNRANYELRTDKALLTPFSNHCKRGLRGAPAGSRHRNSSAGTAEVSYNCVPQLVSCARKPRGLSASGWY